MKPRLFICSYPNSAVFFVLGLIVYFSGVSLQSVHKAAGTLSNQNVLQFALFIFLHTVIPICVPRVGCIAFHYVQSESCEWVQPSGAHITC